MKRVIQFISLAILSFIIVMGCDSMTGSESDIEYNNNNTTLSKSHNSATNDSSTVTVSGDTFDQVEYSGWIFNRDPSTQTPFVFTTDQASIGNGSLYVEPIANSINGNSDKFIGELFLNEEIANIQSISYDFLIGQGGSAIVNAEDHFYLNVYANFGESPFDKYYDCRYDVVPSAGSTSDWTTVTFDPTQSYPVTTRGGASASPYTCPAVPADMDALSDSSTIHFAAINVGDTSGNDDGLDGYYDNVVVSHVDGSTVYDFEIAPTEKSECKKGGWQDFGFKNQGQCIRFVNTGKDSR